MNWFVMLKEERGEGEGKGERREGEERRGLQG